MRQTITFQPVRVRTGHQDTEGRLAFADGELVAVLVRLDDPEHEGDVLGHWFMEAGFGPAATAPTRPFGSINDAAAWLAARLVPLARQP